MSLPPDLASKIALNPRRNKTVPWNITMPVADWNWLRAQALKLGRTESNIVRACLHRYLPDMLAHPIMLDRYPPGTVIAMMGASITVADKMKLEWLKDLLRRLFKEHNPGLEERYLYKPAVNHILVHVLQMAQQHGVPPVELGNLGVLNRGRNSRRREPGDLPASFVIVAPFSGAVAAKLKEYVAQRGMTMTDFCTDAVARALADCKGLPPGPKSSTMDWSSPTPVRVRPNEYTALRQRAKKADTTIGAGLMACVIYHVACLQREANADAVPA